MREDSPLAAREYITPQDLTGLPVISPVSNIAESNVGKVVWRGAEPDRCYCAGESPVQRGTLAQSNVGAVLAIKLDCATMG